MPRPVKWARDLHLVRDRAANSKTETWSRLDLERLFGVGRATAQTLMKAIGDIQAVGGAHFVERSSLLSFLDEMIEAPSVEQGLRDRMLEAEPTPRPKPLRIALPADLRSTMLSDLPSNIMLSPGRIEITAGSAVAMLESLAALALAMQNDLERFQETVEPPKPQSEFQDGDLRDLIEGLRRRALGVPSS